MRYFQSTYHTPIAFATDTSLLASQTVYYTGKEILPIGGYAGGIPSPPLQQLHHFIANGNLRVVLIPIKPASNDPRIVWIHTHCGRIHKPQASRGVEFAFYACDPTVAL